MAKVKVKLNRSGIQALLNGPEVTALVRDETEKVHNRAGEGYETVVGSYGFGKMGSRVRGEVYTATKEAMLDNMETNNLLHALGASDWDKKG